MADWLQSMQQTYEYYIVDPVSWKDIKLLTTVKSSSISRDSTAETLGSASIDLTESIGECYVRIYLVTVQNGVTERYPLGTYLVQTPSYSFNGRTKSVTVDAYTPLIELKENPPPIGYYIPKNETGDTAPPDGDTGEDGDSDVVPSVSPTNIMKKAAEIVSDNVRAPVVAASCSETLNTDFVSNTDDTWMSFASDLIAMAKYRFDLDEMGRILFAPSQDITSLQPIWTYDDGNSSILLPNITVDRDLYGIPNVVEVVYTNGHITVSSTAENNDPNSPVSTVARGRRIIHRVTNPGVNYPLQSQLDEYAKQLLESLSTLEYTVSYDHGYCPVRIGDCVRLNYERAGLTGIKAKVIKQSISCTPGCQVTETAVFTKKLWG